MSETSLSNNSPDNYTAVASVVSDLSVQVASVGLDIAGTAKLGPLWPLVRPVVKKVIEVIGATPNVQVEKLLREFASDDAKFREAAQLAEVILGALKPHHLDTVRRFESLKTMAQISARSRQSVLRHRLAQVWQIGAAVHHLEDKKFPSPYSSANSVFETVLTHLAMVGMGDGAVRAIATAIQNPIPNEPIFLAVGAILSMNIHPSLQLAFTLGWFGCERGLTASAREAVLLVANDFDVAWVVEAYLVDIDSTSDAVARRNRTDELINTLSEWN